MPEPVFDIDGLDAHQQEQLLGLLWESMKRDPEHKDRVRTGWGTKTKEGLLRSINAIFKEHYGQKIDT